MITLHTIIYEGNYEEYLKKDSRFFTLQNELITKKLITVNNVTDIENCNKLLNELKSLYDFDVIYVDDHCDKTKDFFNLVMNETTAGYFYSIPIFVGFLNTTTPFIFHLSSDCLNNNLTITDDFLTKSIDVLGNDDDELIVTTIGDEKQPWSVAGVPPEVPNKSMTCVGEWEQINTANYKPENELKDWWCSDCISDNIFLGNIKKLKKANYNLRNLARFAGPAYGGTASFEYRMAQHLVAAGVYRLIYRNSNCAHQHIAH